jgi:hypothetical protein
MKLEDGWAGAGSLAPTAAAMVTARDTALNDGDGRIQLDIRVGGIEAEIDIGPDGKVAGVFCAPTTTPFAQVSKS